MNSHSMQDRINQAASIVMIKTSIHDNLCDVIDEMFFDKSIIFRNRVLSRCKDLIILYKKLDNFF